MSIAPRTVLRLATLFVLTALFAHADDSEKKSDFATDRLLEISTRETELYEKIATEPDFYSQSDIERRVDDLVKSYRNYLTKNPNDVSALILYGKLLRRVDLHDQAFKAFLKADELDPSIAVVKQQIGTHLAETEKGIDALPFYLEAIDLEPNTAIYHFGLGQLLYEFRDEYITVGIFTRDALDREMLKAFNRAAQLAPENFDAQMRLGEAYYDLATPQWKAALLHWNALQKGTEEGDDIRRDIINLHKARVLGKLGRTEEAQALITTISTPELKESKQKVLTELSAD